MVYRRKINVTIQCNTIMLVKITCQNTIGRKYHDHAGLPLFVVLNAPMTMCIPLIL